MISHSIITVIFMAIAPWLVGPHIAALAITMWWWSREQYYSEFTLRKTGHDSIPVVIGTIFSVWRPARKNMDLIVPAIVAWVIAAVWTLA